MKISIMKSLLIFLSIISLLQSCREPSKLALRSVSANRDTFALRPVTGSRDTVLIDIKTPLEKLILRLQNPWEYVETGKAYWIGYTNDMYSIAYYQDKAINPLMDLIKNTDSLKTKLGALYTLHLIGIQSQVKGRTSEEFKDTLARKAILSFIGNKQLQKPAIQLLRRDPWKYDIPFLIHYLSRTDSVNLEVLRYIRIYIQGLDSIPMWQDLPEALLEKEITIKTNNFFSHPIADIIALKNTLKENVEIDSEILESKEWKDGLIAFKTDTGEVRNGRYINEKDIVFEKPHIKDIGEFGNYRDYEGIFPDDRFFYSHKDGRIYIYGPQKARRILLDWWNNLSSKDRVKIISAKEKT